MIASVVAKRARNEECHLSFLSLQIGQPIPIKPPHLWLALVSCKIHATTQLIVNDDVYANKKKLELHFERFPFRPRHHHRTIYSWAFFALAQLYASSYNDEGDDRQQLLQEYSRGKRPRRRQRRLRRLGEEDVVGRSSWRGCCLVSSEMETCWCLLIGRTCAKIVARIAHLYAFIHIYIYILAYLHVPLLIYTFHYIIDIEIN